MIDLRTLGLFAIRNNIPTRGAQNRRSYPRNDTLKTLQRRLYRTVNAMVSTDPCRQRILQKQTSSITKYQYQVPAYDTRLRVRVSHTLTKYLAMPTTSSAK